MIVYGKRRKKYVLSQNAVSQDYDGAVYSVPANPDILVKIYQPEYRTSETEKLVIDTVNGKCSMLDESPVDVVYANGRFAGYIFETSAQSVPVEPIDVLPPPSVPRARMNEMTVLLICIVIGLGLSALAYFIVFDILNSIIGDPYCYWNFDGIPMIIGGWALMLITYFQFRERGAQAIVISTVAFLLGSAVVFGAISLVIWLLSLAWTLAQALLPTVLTIAIVVWLLKMLLNK